MRWTGGLTFCEVEYVDALLPAPSPGDLLQALRAHATGPTSPEVHADDSLERRGLVAAELEERGEVGRADECDRDLRVLQAEVDGRGAEGVIQAHDRVRLRRKAELDLLPLCEGECQGERGMPERAAS